MKASQLLDDIDPGSDIAESDEHLRNHFVQTSVFKDLVHDRADLILGPKGSGKTALFRMLSEPQFEIPELSDTIVIPAFNTQGHVFFQDLTSAAKPYSEKLLRRLWTAYIISIIGNHLVNDLPASPAVREVRTALASCGLLEVSAGNPRSVWRYLFDSFRRLARPSSIEGRLELGDGLPGVETRLEYPAATGDEYTATTEPKPFWATPNFDSDRLIQTLLEALRTHDLRCWVVFDRLDEAFQDDRELERTALRGLLMAHSDVSSYGKLIRTKLFLRSDILDRITEEAGFVNITHLRSLRITWSRQHIHDMAVKRLLASDMFVTFLDMKNVESKKEVVPLLMSNVEETAKQSRQKNKVNAFSYMVERTADASQDLNPRNIVSFMRAAREIELGRRQLKDADLDEHSSPPITMDSMIKAWRRISENRLIDTLYAEHNSLRASIEKFRNGPQKFDHRRIADLFELDRSSQELADLIASLKYCGFLGQPGIRIYRIADLYRPALGLNPKWEERSSSRSLTTGW